MNNKTKSIIQTFSTYAGYLLLLAVLMTGVYNIWCTTPERIASKLDKPKIENPGIYGDQFGGFNALFSAFAFSALIVTLLMQMNELRLQRNEIHDNKLEFTTQAHALSGEVEISAVSARISAIPILISRTERMLERINSTRYKRGQAELYSDEDFDSILINCRKGIDSNKRLYALAQQYETLTEDIVGDIKQVFWSGGANGSLSISRESILKHIPIWQAQFEAEIKGILTLRELRQALSDKYERLGQLETEFRHIKEQALARIPND